MEKPVLLPKGLTVGIRVTLRSLELHIGVGDFRDRRKVKDDGKDEDEDGNGKINPLHILQRIFACTSVLEEDVGAKDRCDHSADSIEGLRDVDTHLTVPRRTANGNVRVGSGFETP